jgi:hypothetical protein
MLREFVFRLMVDEVIFEDTVRSTSEGEAWRIMEARYGRGSVMAALSERFV